ncbi:hypothetical protein DY000_02063215 [Brassica cretica]|uniref:Phorbol-ester/DAG-type domain-containing protein n=1 Tax=Brassica cretica TaxID=69181 RepID=A0ABQ7AWD4_BRACR|nr:hypothetical protein DY000_02063215 [Brassica cretica]
MTSLLWLTAEEAAKNRGKVLSLYRQLLRSINSPKLQLSYASRLAKKAEIKTIFLFGSEEVSKHNVADLIRTGEYALSQLKQGKIPNNTTQCIDLPYVIKVSRHNHRLAFTPSNLFKESADCGVCYQKIDINYREYSCVKGCVYAMHSRCALRRDVSDGKELEGEPKGSCIEQKTLSRTNSSEDAAAASIPPCRSCVSVLVVSTIAISPNLLIATVFHVTLLVATASPSHLLITAQPLKANRSTRSTHFWNIVSQPVPSSRPILEYHQEHLFTSATPSLPSYASPLFCIPLQLPQLLHRQIRSSTVRFTPSLRSSSLYQLLVPNPHKSLDMSFQSVAMELRFSSGLDESHGSRYGNIRVHLLSWISLCSSSCLIVKSITSHPPRRLVTPIPSESRWYSTDTCFGLNQNHLRSLNVLIIIYLSHQSSSEASCLSMVCRRASLQRVHLAQSRDVELKSPLFVHSSHVSRVSFSSEFVTGAIRVQGPAYLFVSSKSRTLLLFVSDEIHVVSSENIEVGVRAVHARSTSFQTWQFGLINVACDYFMLVVVAYPGTHPLFPMVSRVSFSSEFVTGAIRVQGPAYLFVSSKSRTLLLFVSDEIHVVYSGNIEVGVRAVHARSTSFQT